MADFERKLDSYTPKERVSILDDIASLLDETEDIDDALCCYEDIENDYDMWWEDAKEIINQVYLFGAIWPD